MKVMACILLQIKNRKILISFSLTSHSILPFVLGKTSKQTIFLSYLMLNAYLKNSFFLMPGPFFNWMPANFHFSTSQRADVLYALILFLYIHIYICTCMYIYNLSPLGLSLAITVLLWFCFVLFLKEGVLKLSGEIEKVALGYPGESLDVHC